ncbi:MAG: T9SS type A sorting domain-containing protein [Ignavibacteriaceae bacterium]|nr:T9SS type A sorting domain-containing protein [Ignavibacteriaceae bacterium]
MKKLFLLFALLAILAGREISAQQYPLLTIQEITETPDSILNQGPGVDYSAYLGDTVRFRGVVMVSPIVNVSSDRRRNIAAGPRWYAYVQAQNGLPFGGISVLQDDTTAAFQTTGFDLIDTAQVVEFTAVISIYFGNTVQANYLLNPITPVDIIETLPKRPDPIELPMSTFMNGGVLNPQGEKYEGMYVVIRNVVTSDRNNSSGTFRFNDGNGNYMTMYDQSGYFTKRAHRLTGLTDYDAPLDGTFLQYIRGVVHTRADGYYIVPLYPGDMEVGSTPPSVTNLARNSAYVGSNQSVTVTSRIVDLDGQVTSARVYYRINDGADQFVDMTRGTGADSVNYTGVIPGVAADSAIVSYFVWAQDNEGKVSMNPTDTLRNRYFYPVLNRGLTIQDVQYSPFGGGWSAFNNFRVTVSGVVTADTSDIPGFGSTPTRVYIQNGTGPWSGIWVGGLESLSLQKGDNVTINNAKVVENFSVTRLDSMDNIIINSAGNQLPAPVNVTTGEIGTGFGGVFQESLESVIIKFTNPEIADSNADPNGNFGEILVSDGSGNTRVELQDGNHQYNNAWEPNLPGIVLKDGDKFTELKGILYYSFSNYKLVPRKDDDFEGFTPLSVKDGEMPQSFSLSQNYPNPFNPATSIQYSTAVSGMVQLDIYNVLGQKVKTLVNQYQDAGSYRIIFNASELTSGMYIYQLRSNEQTISKKMLLVK